MTRIAKNCKGCDRILIGATHQSIDEADFSTTCVRKAFLAGRDVLTYAIMSNHLHVILRNRPDVVEEWSDEEVALRWLRVFPGRRLDEQLAEPTDSDVKR